MAPPPAPSFPPGLVPRLMDCQGVAGVPSWSTHRLAPQARISMSTRHLPVPGASLFSETSCWWPLAPFVCMADSFAGPGGFVSPGPEGKEGPGFSGCGWRRKSRPAVQEAACFGTRVPAWGCWQRVR